MRTVFNHSSMRNHAMQRHTGSILLLQERLALPFALVMLMREAWVHRPVRNGSISAKIRCPRDVRFPPDRDQIANISAFRFRAIRETSARLSPGYEISVAPPNRGALNSTHIHGTHVPVEEPSTASEGDILVVHSITSSSSTFAGAVRTFQELPPLCRYIPERTPSFPDCI